MISSPTTDQATPGPIRTCVGCRQKAAQAELLRFVYRGDDLVDATRPRLPGRRIYVHQRCVEQAHRRRAFRRR